MEKEAKADPRTLLSLQIDETSSKILHFLEYSQTCNCKILKGKLNQRIEKLLFIKFFFLLLN